MADLVLSTQGAPATPAAGTGVLYLDTTSKELVNLDADGNKKTVRTLTNASTADVTANAADTYLTGSLLTIPPALVRVGTQLSWQFAMSKTAAETAAPVWSVRVGTNGTTADTARLQFTGVAQTAAVDNGFAQIVVVIRSIGAAGVAAGVYLLDHVGNTVGLANVPSDVKQVTSAGYDTTVANTKYGVSLHPGAAGVWTFQLVSAQLLSC